MKEKLLILLIIASVNYCFGQVSIGAKGGLNSNKLTVNKNEFKSESTRYGLVFGGTLRFRVSNLSLQPELVYSQKGGEYSYSTLADGYDTLFKNRINYIDFPLMFGYHPFYNLNLHTGPVFGFLVNEKIEFEVEGTSIHSNINKAANKEISFGWQFGASLEIKRLSFVLRYEVEVYESVDDIIIPNSGVILKPGIRNSLWQFTVGYKLFSMAAE